MAKPVYTTLPNGTKLGAVVDDTLDIVMVHIVGGKRIGGFWLNRFDGGKLTSKSLYNFFS